MVAMSPTLLEKLRLIGPSMQSIGAPLIGQVNYLIYFRVTGVQTFEVRTTAIPSGSLWIDLGAERLFRIFYSIIFFWRLNSCKICKGLLIITYKVFRGVHNFTTEVINDLSLSKRKHCNDTKFNQINVKLFKLWDKTRSTSQCLGMYRILLSQTKRKFNRCNWVEQISE